MKKNLKNMKDNIVKFFLAMYVSLPYCVYQLGCTDLFSDTTGSTSAVADFSAAYQHWFIVIFLILCGSFLLLKDEKKKGIAKTATIGSVIVFIMSFSGVQSVITATFTKVAGYFGGGGS